MIKGLTDKMPALPQIGTIRKGAPKTENKPGKDLDEYFRFESTDTDAAAAFTALYGAQPKAIEVILPYPTVGENFDAWQEEYTASALKHRCDGETCVLWLQPNGTYSQEPKKCPSGCKPVGRLKVIIPELGRMAMVMVMTTSKNDIINLHRNLLTIEQSVGRLTGIRFWLRRVPVKISTPAAGGQRARREKWLLQIEPKREWVAAFLATSEQRALASASGAVEPPQQLALNPAPEDFEDDDAEVFEGEPVVEDASVSRTDALEMLRALWAKAGKDAADFPAYASEKLAGKTVAQLMDLGEQWAAKLQADKGADKAAA